MDLAERHYALDQFYEQLDCLEVTVGGKRMLSECNGTMDWPRRGVYFFFEDGEFRSDGFTPRVVRVGTHALRPSLATLWGRLSQHRGNIGGTRSLGGNHRGSVFRLHVGTALLASGNWSEEVAASWGRENAAKSWVREFEYPLEVAVSQYIGRMPFLWVAVDDEPSASSDRGVIEVGAISLLSNFDRVAIDAASASWLGKSADRSAVRSSGLWNVNHVQHEPTADFLDTLSTWAAR